MATVEVAEFHTVGEGDPVPLPVEAVGEQNTAIGSRRYPVEFDRRSHAISDPQHQLIGMGFGQSMWLPGLHPAIVHDPPLSIRTLGARGARRGPAGTLPTL